MIILRTEQLFGSATERHRNSHHNASNREHLYQASQPRAKSGVTREHIAAHEQHHDCDGVGNPKGRTQLVYEQEWA